MAPKRPTDGQPGPAAGAGLTRKGKGKAKAAARAEDSGSEDLVSDDDPPQAPVEDDGEGSDFDELQVDFEFFDLKEIDFHGLRALLQRYLDGELPFALSELVEALIAQSNSVGTVVKANGDVDPLGVMSLLPLDRHRDTSAVKQVLAFMRRKCGSSEAAALFERACASPRTALLLSERMLNMPPELAAPLVGGLFEEVGDIGGDWWWKSEPAPSEALVQSFKVDRYLVLTRVYRDDEVEEAAAAPPAKRSRPAAATAPRLIFPKPEDEALHAHAAWSFLFPAVVPEATAVADRAGKVTQMRLVMCVDADKAAAVRRDTERFAAQGHE